MIAWISLCLMGLAAFFSWRTSRPISMVLWLAFGSTCAYALGMEYFPEAHARGAFEAQRLVSAVVGSAGVWELMRRAFYREALVGKRYEKARELLANTGEKARDAIRDARNELIPGRLDLLALACVASCAVDFVAYFGFYHGLAWSLPWVQSGVCAGMVGLCVWPRKEGEP